LGVQIPDLASRVSGEANISPVKAMPRIAPAAARQGTVSPAVHFSGRAGLMETPMRSILLWAIGVPVPIILLLAFCTHHF